MNRSVKTLAILLIVTLGLCLAGQEAQAIKNPNFPLKGNNLSNGLSTDFFTLQGKKLNILTINLMMINPSSPFDWPDRAATLVSFIQQQEELDQPIHLILLQEGHGGLLSEILGGGGDTILDLRDRLHDVGINYYARSIVSFENPEAMGFESNFLVGVLCKYPILYMREVDSFCGGDINSENRKIIACAFMVPGIGMVAAYSAHFSSQCLGDAAQADDLLDLINSIPDFHPVHDSPIVHIVGGDFNAFKGSDLYEAMTDDGFIDTFFAANGDVTWGGTYDIAGNPFGYVGANYRIDYIFVKGWGDTKVEVGPSRVVLNGTHDGGDFMSDHCGVLSRIGVQPPKGAKPMKYRRFYPFVPID